MEISEEMCACGHEKWEHTHSIGKMWGSPIEEWGACRACAKKPKSKHCRFYRAMNADELHRLAGIEKPHQSVAHGKQLEMNFGRK